MHQYDHLGGKSEQVSPQEKQEGVEGHLLHHHCSCLKIKLFEKLYTLKTKPGPKARTEWQGEFQTQEG